MAYNARAAQRNSLLLNIYNPGREETDSKTAVKPFDIDLAWIGKSRNFEQAIFWSADTDEERLTSIQRARNGGSITPRFQKNPTIPHRLFKTLSSHPHHPNRLHLRSHHKILVLDLQPADPRAPQHLLHILLHRHHTRLHRSSLPVRNGG